MSTNLAEVKQHTVLAHKIVTKTYAIITKIKKNLQMIRKCVNVNSQYIPTLNYNHLDQLTNAKNQLKKKQKLLNETDCLAAEPNIEVGCLEWVIQQMEKDSNGAWAKVTFIPQG